MTQRLISLIEKSKHQKNAQNFSFDGKTLGQVIKKCTEFTFLEEIPFDVEFTFHIKIIEINFICIGVLDHQDYEANRMNVNNNVSWTNFSVYMP